MTTLASTASRRSPISEPRAPSPWINHATIDNDEIRRSKSNADRIIADDRAAAVGTAPGAGLGGKGLVNPGKEAKKRGVLQYVVAHFGGLLVVVNRRLPGGDLLIKIPDGDPYRTIMKLARHGRNRHQESWRCSRAERRLVAGNASLREPGRLLRSDLSRAESPVEPAVDEPGMPRRRRSRACRARSLVYALHDGGETGRSRGHGHRQGAPAARARRTGMSGGELFARHACARGASHAPMTMPGRAAAQIEYLKAENRLLRATFGRRRLVFCFLTQNGGPLRRSLRRWDPRHALIAERALAECSTSTNQRRRECVGVFEQNGMWGANPRIINQAAAGL